MAETLNSKVKKRRSIRVVLRGSVKVLLQVAPTVLIGYAGQRYITAGALPKASVVVFVLEAMTGLSVIIAAGFFVHWLMVRGR